MRKSSPKASTSTAPIITFEGIKALCESYKIFLNYAYCVA
jgi:hypothetical protein